MASTGEQLILASASASRARLLRAAGIEVVVEPAVLDEQVLKRAFRADRREAGECAVALAEAKAQQISQRHPRALIIGADQILVCEGAWFDKPSSLSDARAQLEILRDRAHELATAACVVRAGERIWHGISTPRLTMRHFSSSFLDEYLADEGAEVLSSVGVYRLEGRGIQLFERIEGDYFAILGLPLVELLAFLRDCAAVPC